MSSSQQPALQQYIQVLRDFRERVRKNPGPAALSLGIVVQVALLVLLYYCL